ncbi:efflux RND transporter periplasmic adaptor subunit [Haliea sp. E1-2-M8]|uniref:efflux RND transporter periplasmic adaptor subunit n=1 Tax=Haliea sp. E1-2-M8 TaxID=3064706 RepID=UPI00271CC3D3|nr:efflux RND transporter periplasmic adaptor subunit [Haliea sp. E1-2-M8]MDO8860678.1 efflux RND transporter periplasmic adaptor subunit [Haliea sp. E1-2-M8]
MRAYLIAIAMLLLIFGAIAAYLYQQFSGFANQGFSQPPVTVAAAAAEESLWPETLTATGSIRAARGVELSSEESGEVTSIAVRSGDRVAAGELLLQLNDRAEQASRERQRAAVDLARLLFERDARLLEQKSIPQTQFDRSRADLEVAEAQLAETEAVLANKQLRAPFAGTVGIVNARVGDYVEAGTRVASLQDLTTLEVDFAVPARFAPLLRPGLRVSIAVPGFEQRLFDATLTALDSLVDADTRSLLLRAELKEGAGLLPGMFARISIDLDRTEARISVPETAITYSTSGDTVFVIETGEEGGLQVQPRVVRIGAAANGRIAIVEGLAPGERIVTAGQNKLYRGASVQIDENAPL